MTTHDPHEPHALPPELAAADQAMRTLGAAERAAAPQGMEERLVRASRPALLAAAAGEAASTQPSDVAGRITPILRHGRFAGSRVAAGLAILGACGAVWLAVRGDGSGSAMAQTFTFEEDLETWMPIAFDDPFTGSLGAAASEANASPLESAPEWRLDDFDLSEGSS